MSFSLFNSFLITSHEIFLHYFSTGLVQRQDEEARFNQLMVTEKLPKELAKNEKYIQELQNVISEPAMSQNDLDKISRKVTQLLLINKNPKNDVEISMVYDRKSLYILVKCFL